MFELLVPAERSQIDGVNGDMARYDSELRPQLMVQAIQELQDAGVEPDLWKIEGLDRREDCEEIVATARCEGRISVGCIVLGRGEDEGKGMAWLETAASVPGFLGFAIGRTTFWQPLLDWRAGAITRGEAVAEIARRYRDHVDVFETKGGRPCGHLYAPRRTTSCSWD